MRTLLFNTIIANQGWLPTILTLEHCMHANTPKMINRFTLRTRHTFLKNLFMTRKLIFLREPNLDQPMLTYLSSNVLSRFQRLLAPTSQEKAYLWWRKWRGWQKVVPMARMSWWFPQLYTYTVCHKWAFLDLAFPALISFLHIWQCTL